MGLNAGAIGPAAPAVRAERDVGVAYEVDAKAAANATVAATPKALRTA